MIKGGQDSAVKKISTKALRLPMKTSAGGVRRPSQSTHSAKSQVTTDPSEVPVVLIASEHELQSFLDKNGNSLMPYQATSVGVYFQFASKRLPGDSIHTDQDNIDQLAAIAIASTSSSKPAVVLQLESLSKKRVITGLKTLLTDSSTLKVMHNVHQVAFWLHCYGLQDIELANCMDLQLLHETTVDPTALSVDILKIMATRFPTQSTNLPTSLYSFMSILKLLDDTIWTSIPLSGRILQKLTHTAQLYAQCCANFPSDTTTIAKCTAMTSARWKNAIVNKGCRAIWFDPDADNQPRSLECIELNSALVESSEQTSEKHKSTPVALPSLQLQCELDPLLKVLPTEYQHAILAIDNYHGKLVDVCLDVGRTPYVYTGKRQRAVLTQDGSTVSKETIDEVLRKLGGEMRIGNDNRVGIDQQLHRISVMRSKTDEVYGLTMRVGRALRNAACSLTDLLLSQRHNNKSVLVLGHPGSGKTTLIRDVARCVSETMENVCIIDIERDRW